MKITNEIEVAYVLDAIIFEGNASREIIDRVVNNFEPSEREEAIKILNERLQDIDYVINATTIHGDDLVLLSVKYGEEDAYGNPVSVRKVFPTPFGKIMTQAHVEQVVTEALHMAIVRPDCPLKIKKIFLNKLKAEIDGYGESEPVSQSDEFPSGI